VLCNTHDTSIVDTYVTIPVSPRSRYTAVYRIRTKYCETAQVSRVSTIPCSSYHLTTCTLQACDAETNSISRRKSQLSQNWVQQWVCTARTAVNKYNPISYFCISTALLTTCTKLPISKTDHALLRDPWPCKIRIGTKRANKLIIAVKLLKYEERLRYLNLPTLKYWRIRRDTIEVYKMFSGRM